MYDPHLALQSIDAHSGSILLCLIVTAAFAFAYFAVAIRIALRQQVYVVPLAGAALFFWHDLSFVLMYEQWFVVYDHWWVKLWWVALCATVPLEAYLIWQVIRYGRRELWPQLPLPAHLALVLGACITIGALWLLVKRSIADDLFFITFAITAVWSVPFHTALMLRRQSRAGQSVFMEASTIVMILSMTAAFAQIDGFFRSPVYLGFVATAIGWAFANIALILSFPPLPATDRDRVRRASSGPPPGTRRSSGHSMP